MGMDKATTGTRVKALENSNPSKSKHRSTSRILKEILDVDEQNITMQELSERLGDRGFGLMLLLFALPNAIPLPMPGVSTITSLPLIYFSAQLCLGRERLWLPNWLARREIPSSVLKRIIVKSMPWLERLERWVRPRMDRLTTRTYERIAGALVFILACLIALPIPLGNLPSAVAIILLALAITERDGVLMITGWLVSLLAVCFTAALVVGYAWVFWQLIRSIF